MRLNYPKPAFSFQTKEWLSEPQYLFCTFIVFSRRMFLWFSGQTSTSIRDKGHREENVITCIPCWEGGTRSEKWQCQVANNCVMLFVHKIPLQNQKRIVAEQTELSSKWTHGGDHYSGLLYRSVITAARPCYQWQNSLRNLENYVKKTL